MSEVELVGSALLSCAPCRHRNSIVVHFTSWNPPVDSELKDGILLARVHPDKIGLVIGRGGWRVKTAKKILKTLYGINDIKIIPDDNMEKVPLWGAPADPDVVFYAVLKTYQKVGNLDFLLQKWDVRGVGRKLPRLLELASELKEKIKSKVETAKVFASVLRRSSMR
ncbi:MAG: hypothetical protein ACTSX6_10415 [Candidatus Heimdallarchaeaceae archaeon]